LDQRPSVRAFPCPCRNEQQQFLKVLIQPGRRTAASRDNRAASAKIQPATAG
jgi:hypothetical protein